MSKAKQKILLFLLVFSLFLFTVTLVDASGLLNKQDGFGSGGAVTEAFSGEGETQDIRITIAKVIRYFLGFMGIIFTVLIVYAGFLWMTAAGNESKVEESKKILSRSIIGLIIILASYSITALVICSAVDVTGDNPFNCIF